MALPSQNLRIDYVEFPAVDTGRLSGGFTTADELAVWSDVDSTHSS